MRKLFVQFFLLLFVCFLVMAMLVGLVYKVTSERTGHKSMDDLMKSSLYLMCSELREAQLKDCNKTIASLDLSLSFNLHIEPLGKQDLAEEIKKRLLLGEIIVLDDQYTFMQRIPRSYYVLVVGPIPYLFILSALNAAVGSGTAGVSMDVSALARFAQTGERRPALRSRLSG